MSRNSTIARTSAVAAIAMVVAGAWLLAGMLAIPLISQGLANPHITEGAERTVPITDPTNLPRLSFQDLRYVGAFRLPSGPSNGDSFAAGGGPLAFNAARGSLFAGARSGRVAEISIPAPLDSSDVRALPVAEYLQDFSDPAEGGMKTIAKDGAGLSGLLVYQGRLYGTGLIYYDANHTQRLSHFARPLSLVEKGASPMRSVWDERRSGFVAGYLALVPPEWQSRLGGPAITGQCCVPIISRTSHGPAAFAFDPAELEAKDSVEARPLVYYPGDHPTLGPWSGSNPTYGGTTEVAGLALLSGTRTALFIGRNGLGPYCYGIGTSDRSLDRSDDGKGGRLCFDPTTADKGQHAYPYRYQMWAYDLSELAEVRAGRRDPWSVKPYGVWPFDLPTPEASTRLLGVAYDATGRRLFISQRSADRDTYASRALIHVYRHP